MHQFSLRNDLADFGEWWLAELVAMTPAAVRKKQTADCTLVVGRDSVHSWHAAGASGDVTEPRELFEPQDLRVELEGLVRSAHEKKRPIVDLVLGSGRFLERQVAPFRLPSRRASAMAALDLQSSTPLDPATVIMLFATGDADRSDHRYFVVKRETLKPLLAAIEQAGARLGTMRAESEGGPVELYVEELGALVRPAWRDRLQRGFFRVVVAASAVLAIATLGHAQWHYREGIRQLDTEIEALGVEVKTVRALSDERNRRVEQIESVRVQRAQAIPLAKILEELTRLVPDDSWIIDLSIEDDKVTFSGFSSSAAGLIATLDASPLFSGPTFTAPVVKAPGADGERFTLVMKLER
ncbi:PilN domain-containing protein [Kumtagia ephedrae]|jgi:general secretion pathway protein L|uniref:Fimbrial assembly protein n=1 Tax=Kumtagia ephedrae TaxID=2116701 RepID=A0A2P7SLT5_9HYPH|nr:PilN domain-containing protein [Mesorhizobium ephedrae]PSJ63452.1 fimbrial assembly protein [Mesorhizobium ephedrae]